MRYPSLKDKNIILGVSGGIAAYKSVELLRQLRKQDAVVRVIMTDCATRFVAPLTFEALSGTPVCTTLFGNNDASIKHIEWAEEASAVIIAPATANIIGKVANGIADDALSTLMMAITCPALICPAMNTHMYENLAVQRNIDTLIGDGHHILEPDSGQLACGTYGPGRLPDPEFIIDRLAGTLTTRDFSTVNILVTAGPTREMIDPVRYIGNLSSGKMGYAIARAAEHRGANVTLVSGPTSLPDPSNVKVIRINSAEEMADAVFKNLERARVVIKSAAVSDYSPKETSSEKIKKDQDEMILTLGKNRDILKEIGQKKENRIIVGFAAETQSLKTYAEKKLTEKNLDMIVGNIVGKTSSPVFGSETNTITLFDKNGKSEDFPEMDKFEVAHTILDRVSKLLKEN
ncbi:MAG: bifunctional phosphopantothenoylcysteine decarboxylase/phosphopantothenate--cysteine ligase CoaBC [Desulfobacterales bacterium]|nr:bifunctional phosphopantothenoylcysteine decarboxylase/phosphopantothenate--cysteine ligase CoaBC [Desulfobacterales bacterium]